MPGISEMTYDTIAQGDNTQGGVIAQFYLHPVYMRRKSEEEGRPIYEDFVYIRKIIPGNDKEIVERKATEEDHREWPRQWTAFQESKEQPISGTPINQASFLTPSWVSTCKHLNIMTVEALANLPDPAINKLGMGGREIINHAQTYLKSAEGSARFLELENENKELKTQVEKLQETLQEIMEPVKKKTAPKKRAKEKEVDE